MARSVFLLTVLIGLGSAMASQASVFQVFVGTADTDYGCSELAVKNGFRGSQLGGPDRYSGVYQANYCFGTLYLDIDAPSWYNIDQDTLAAPMFAIGESIPACARQIMEVFGVRCFKSSLAPHTGFVCGGPAYLQESLSHYSGCRFPIDKVTTYSQPTFCTGFAY